MSLLGACLSLNKCVMEEKKFESLMREDRENDLDDIDLGGFVFEEGMDYEKCLKRQQEEETVRSREEGEPKPPDLGGGTQRNRKSQLRTVHLGFTVSEETAKKLRILAACNSTTLSTYIHDLLVAHIETYNDLNVQGF